jgi:hypothetical protein
MTVLWWCIDCDKTVQLDRHGRCGTCCSDAVVSMEEPASATCSTALVTLLSVDS